MVPIWYSIRNLACRLLCFTIPVFSLPHEGIKTVTKENYELPKGVVPIITVDMPNSKQAISVKGIGTFHTLKV